MRFERVLPGLLASFLTACQAPGVPAPATAQSRSSEALVHFQPTASDAARAALREQFQASDVATLYPDAERWRLPEGADVSAVVASLSADPAVKGAQANYVRRLEDAATAANPTPSAVVAGAPNDPRFAEQWNLRQANFPEAWQYATGRGITVAVIDSGVDPNHPDLKANLLPGIDEMTALEGPDVVNGTDYTGRDGIGHGTHVAGIIAAAANNGIGIAGAAPEAKILPIKAADASGSLTDGTIAKGIADAVIQGARVINLSLGSEGEDNPPPAPVLMDALAYALNAGVVIVAASGNDGHGVVKYPAALRGIIAVAALTSSGQVADYSDWGPELAVAAPGGDRPGQGPGVLSTLPTYTVHDEYGAPLPQSYGSLAGTSMAAPHVSAAAALLLQREPSLTPAQMWVRLAARAQSRNILGFDEKTGFGALDALRAVQGGADDYVVNAD